MDRKIQIKINAINRLHKEMDHYEKELEKNIEKLNSMKNDEADKYDIKKQEEMVQESCVMIPNAKKRLQTFLDELKNLLEETNEVDKELLIKANDLLEKIILV
tara:strand:- start:451 stop:759 length:309 start_codon:yes stop_codon:yes gene_type:complete